MSYESQDVAKQMLDREPANHFFPRDFDEPISAPFSAIDALDVLNKSLSETEELVNLLAKRTEFYRAPVGISNPDSTENTRPIISGMTDAILQVAERVGQHNVTLKYLLDTLR